MSKFEAYIDEIENSDSLSEEARETVVDSLVFISALHDSLRENGYTAEEEPNIEFLETCWDGLHGELAAASIFLSEEVFKSVPKMLRICATQVGKNKDQVVPGIVAKGFSSLADRIEATRVQQHQMKELLKEATPKH